MADAQLRSLIEVLRGASSNADALNDAVRASASRLLADDDYREVMRSEIRAELDRTKLYGRRQRLVLGPDGEPGKEGHGLLAPIAERVGGRADPAI